MINLKHRLKYLKKWIITKCYQIIEWCDQETVDLEIKPGDVYWCKMPLSEQKLMTVEPGHRIRPYVISAVEADQVKGYACSSKPHLGCSVYQQAEIDHKKYKLRKSSYVNISREVIIPLDCLKDYYYTLEKNDFDQIKKDNNKEKTIEIGIGSVIMANDKMYYIYNYKTPYFYVYPLLKKAELVNWSVLQTIACNKQVYYIDYDSKQRLNQNIEFKKYMQLSKKDIHVIETGQNGYAERPKHVSVSVIPHVHVNFLYPLGQIFYEPFQDRWFIYFYSQKNRDYGCFLDDCDDGQYRIHKVNLDYMKLDGIMAADELAEIIKRVCVSDSNCYPLELVRNNINNTLITARLSKSISDTNMINSYN